MRLGSAPSEGRRSDSMIQRSKSSCSCGVLDISAIVNIGSRRRSKQRSSVVLPDPTSPVTTVSPTLFEMAHSSTAKAMLCVRPQYTRSGSGRIENGFSFIP